MQAGERGRLQDAHPPLRHAEVRLAESAHLAVGPRLLGDPLDHVVQIFLLVGPEKLEVAPRLPGATHIHMDVRVALLHVEIDRPGLAPQELRAGRQRVVVIAIGRRREQHGEWSRPVGHVERDRDLDAVVNANFDLA
jgi:hypothetical protein